MVPGNDHAESLHKSVQLVKDAFAPFESNIRKAVKDFEHCWSGLNNGAKYLDSLVENKTRVRSLFGNRGRHVEFQMKGSENSVEKSLSIGVLFDHLVQNIHKFNLGIQEIECASSNLCLAGLSTNMINHIEAFIGVLECGRKDVNGFLRNAKFARVGGVPSSIVPTDPEKEEIYGDVSIGPTGSQEVNREHSSRNIANGSLSIPLSSVDHLRPSMSTVSLAELVELVQHLGKSSCDHPDKNKLFSVQDFFRYSEAEGRRFFDELDRDGDGKVNLEDLEVALRRRKLPKKYAHDLMCRTRAHLFSKSFSWGQFLSVVEQKEATVLRAYTSLCLSKSGTPQKDEILASLKNAGLVANEDNAAAMLQFLDTDAEDSISYGHFRNFFLLLPADKRQKDLRNLRFKASNVAPMVDIPAESVLKSALAGGISCAFSSFVMHPVDTIKTQVQASTLTLPEIVVKIPQIGARGLYKGSIPAVSGQFLGHGLRTAICEASKLVLVYLAPTLPDIQVQSAASLCSTILGTAFRVPTEVLKQRLQAGLYDNVGEAFTGTWQQDGLKGFFRGTGATLCREIPFYVAGAGLYAESKKAFQHLLMRELEPWETILVGAVSGGLASVTTTPFDVIKTRMMTATPGQPVSMSMIALAILRQEGPLGLFKGAVPRFFWVAPLGAMNFAGYELIRKAMDNTKVQKVSTTK